VEKTFNLQTLAHLRSTDTAAEGSPNPYNCRRAMFFLLGPPIQKLLVSFTGATKRRFEFVFHFADSKRIFGLTGLAVPLTCT